MPDSFASTFARAVVVAPTHNNAGTLRDIIARVRKLGLPLIVVDDGSTDATAAVLDSDPIRNDPGVSVLTHPANRGKAAALMTGFTAAAAAGFTHAVTINTDGQLDPEQVPDLLAVAKRRPDALVIGRRDENTEGYPARSRLGRRASNLLVWMESGVRVTDSQCGLRVYPLGLVASSRCRSQRYGFETEIITRAGWLGVPVVETPVRCRYFPRGQAVSHFRPWLDSLRAVGMHGRLLLSALSPLAGNVRRPDGRRGTHDKIWRRLVRWMSPREAWRQLRAGEVGRSKAAAGLAVGAFIANLPAYGMQTVLSLYCARRLHLHPLAVVAGSQLSTPPLGPLLVAAAIGVGHLLLHGRLPHVAEYRAVYAQIGLWPVVGSFLFEWLVGSVVVGLFSAAAMFLAAMRLLRLTARGAADDDEAGEQDQPSAGAAWPAQACSTLTSRSPDTA